MEAYYLAIDIGASGGRHILGCMREGRLYLEEVHRFPNGMKNRNGRLCWDLEALFSEIIAGMKKCRELGKIPVSVGIDTWGVDFVLLDRQGEVLGDAVGYRDRRTEGMDFLVQEILSEEELYSRTGIQKAIFNTIYQLMAVKTDEPSLLEEAESLLFIPDYFHYRLSGIKANEYTESSTSQLLSPVTKDWDWELIGRLGFPASIFGEISQPGRVLGGLTEAVKEEVGYDCKVVLPASHDTGSAVLAVPSEEEDTVYISSGTWSLMGIEREEADCSFRSREYNFTNEGGYEYRFRYLKNIMGLWMIQSVKKELEEEGIVLSYAALCKQASRENITSLVDCNDGLFLAPERMIRAIQNFCEGTGQQIPATPGELASVVYRSLAHCYGDTIKELEERTGKAYRSIHVVGGGSNAGYLNELTAKHTGKTVYAGPGEATAVGNLMVQMLANKKMTDLSEARKCVRRSFAIEKYEP